MFNGFFTRQRDSGSHDMNLLQNLIQNALEGTNNDSVPREVLEYLHNNSVENNESGIQCSVCLESINVGDVCVELRCSHKFHLRCIERWCESHNTCPMCRTIIESTSERESNQRTQRIIINNISIVHINITYEEVVYDTYWQSCNTIVDIFQYFQRLHQHTTRLMLQFENKIFKTTESYEFLAHSLSQHGIVGELSANLHKC